MERGKKNVVQRKTKVQTKPKKLLNEDDDDLSLLDLTVSVVKKEIPIRQQLGQLWTKAAEMYVSVTELQQQLINENYTADDSCSATQAMGKYARLLIEYEKEGQVLGVFEQLHREKTITVALDGITVDGVKTNAKGGSFEKDDFFLNSCRELANIIISNTRVTSEGTIIASTNTASAQLARFPYVETVALRKLFRNFEPDFTRARDQLYARLKSWKNPMYIVNISSLILQEPCLAPIRLQITEGALFDQYQVMKRTYFEKIPAIYVFRRAAPKHLGFKNPDDAWKYRDAVVKLRGDDRKQGNLSSGYYRFDMTPALNRLMEELSDIIFVCRSAKLTAVKLEKPNYELARLLVVNGITVYAPSMTNVVETDPVFDKKQKSNKKVVTMTYGPPGIFYEGKQTHLVYIGFSSAMPSVAAGSVVYPPGMVLRKERAMLVVEPIPRVFDSAYKYLPSSRADKGFCLKTNIQSLRSATLESLSLRFTNAVQYRSWYIYSRMPFWSQDPFRFNFSYPIILPKIRKEVAKLDFTRAIEEEVDDLGIVFSEEMIKESLLRYEAKPVARAEAAVDQAVIEDMFQSIADLKSYKVYEIMEKVRQGSVSDTPYDVLLPYGQRDTLERLSEIYATVAGREAREKREAERKKLEKKRQAEKKIEKTTKKVDSGEEDDQSRDEDENEDERDQDEDQDQSQSNDDEDQQDEEDDRSEDEDDQAGTLDLAATRTQSSSRDTAISLMNDGFSALMSSVVEEFYDEEKT